MRVWSIKGWFYAVGTQGPSEHTLTVAASSLDSAIDVAVEEWNNQRHGVSSVGRKHVYGVSQILTLDGVEEKGE